MLDRLWSGKKYVRERNSQGPLTPDPMISRLWDGHKYPVQVHTGARNDPVLDRLWNEQAYRDRGTDPMLGRLWNGERYSNGTPELDPMLCRLWSNARYPNERYVSVRQDPMFQRPWSDARFPHEQCISVKQAISRLWNGGRDHQDSTLSHQNTPMLTRLWNGERHGERRREEIQDPMMKRLWATTRYRDDPMISRLRAAARYREDAMLDRLWSGESYSELEQGVEIRNALVTSEPTFKSPIPRSPIPKNLYLHEDRYLAHHVSEIQNSSEDEDDEIDVVSSSQRHSGVFTAFFNSIKTDIPLVNEYLKNQEYANVLAEDDDFDDFVQQQPLLYHAPNEQHVHFEDLLPSSSLDYDTSDEEAVEDEEDEEEELPFRNDSSALRIRTTHLPSHPSHLSSSLDTAHVPSSGAPSSPATPSDAGAPQDLHPEPSIPDSWSPPRDGLLLGPVAAGKQDADAFTKYAERRGVGNHFNSVPQNPNPNPRAGSSRDVGRERSKEEGGSQGRAAFLGRLSRMAGGLYHGGTGEERGRLLDED